MKMEVESKFNIGDRVCIDIYDEVDVVDVKFTTKKCLTLPPQ